MRFRTYLRNNMNTTTETATNTYKVNDFVKVYTYSSYQCEGSFFYAQVTDINGYYIGLKHLVTDDIFNVFSFDHTIIKYSLKDIFKELIHVEEKLQRKVQDLNISLQKTESLLKSQRELCMKVNNMMRNNLYGNT